jgi:uncharacterized protein YcbK (DUF882 family)
MANFSRIKWFKPGEFVNPDMMDQRLIEQLGRPITITSSWRDPQRNRAAGGAPESQHLLGQAVDLRLSADGQYHYDIVKLALELGFTGVGERRLTGKGGMLHLDTRPRALRAKWTYGSE